ncbi:MAG: PKD domain-containing protein [Bacteroidales bacterium]|jgi:hypothetical protein|nr:PKD domain-containing protein [Bacteroidales bacterium]
MNKQITKLKTSFLPLFALFSLIIFTGCAKENADNGVSGFSKSLQVPAKLMQDPIVKEMLNELSSYKIHVNKHGILEFSTAKEANEVMDLLQDYSDKFDLSKSEDEDDEYPRDPILCAFEEAYHFYSLRRKIEEELLQLEEKELLTDENDPDDHYVVSTLMRTILNPECVFIYDQLLCVHYDLFCVGIMDYDFNTMEQVCAIGKEAHTEKELEEQMIVFCNSSPAAFIIGSDYAQYVADFSIRQDAANAQNIKFINHSYSEEYARLAYHWDFGDGSTSSEKHPNHVFTSDESTVCLTVLKDGVVLGRRIFPIRTRGCNANFTYYQTLQNMQYCFSSNSSVGSDRIIDYKWDFDDGTTSSGATSFVNHTYGSVGTYHVSLTVTTASGCTSTRSQWVSVRSLGKCCKTMDREKDKEITYNYGNTDYVVKSILRVTNFVGFHRVCTRVVHYKKNKNVKIEAKTPTKGLGTAADGDLNFYADTNNVCGTRTKIERVWDYKDKCKSRIQRDKGMGMPFTIEKEALIDLFRVNAKRNDWERSSVKLHDKPC